MFKELLWGCILLICACIFGFVSIDFSVSGDIVGGLLAGLLGAFCTVAGLIKFMRGI